MSISEKFLFYIEYFFIVNLTVIWIYPTDNYRDINKKARLLVAAGLCMLFLNPATVSCSSA